MPIPIGISGSRSAAVLNLSPYQSQVDVWLDIMEAREPGFCNAMGYATPEHEYNAAMRWGHALESAIAELTESNLNLEISDREKYFERDHAGAMLTCHVDGILNGDTLYEAKTTTAYAFSDTWGDPGSDRIPRMYQVQVQHNMMLAGLSRAVVSVLVFPRRVEEWEEMGIEILQPEINGGLYGIKYGTGEYDITTPWMWAKPLSQMGFLHHYHITANPELQSLMLEHYADFWNAHVVGRTEPPVRNYDDIKKLCREPKGTIVADEFIERQLSEYDQINTEINEMTRRKDQIKTIAVEYMRRSAGDDNVIDDDSAEKYILRSRDGKKLASYGKDKQGRLIFR